jgi:c(7)-type cytochrome triheme protein
MRRPFLFGLTVTFCLVVIVTMILAQEGTGSVVWVQPEGVTLSNGIQLSKPLQPGQLVYVSGTRLQPLNLWRPPQDIEATFTPEDASRVTFSHERHFAALGAKECTVCHEQLDKGKTWDSLAADVSLEPHQASSTGRFCSSCHDGQTKISEIKNVKPPVDVNIFSAFGQSKDQNCNQCHTPSDHGTDFTLRHAEMAEEGGSQSCVTCHRGAESISRNDASQARAFIKAQLALIKNSDDQAAFKTTLPNSFCLYCHAEGTEGN